MAPLPIHFDLPRLPAVHLPRPRLRDALLQADCRLRLLCAPAGSGKSVLMGECLRQCPAGTRIVHLDLRGQALGAEALLQCLSAALGLPGDDLASVKLRLGGEEQPLWLLLDDYPRLPDAQLDQLLNELILGASTQVRWWIASRRRPRLQLARLLLEGGLFELGRHELAFCENEMSALQQQTGHHLSRPMVVELLERSRGWCAGSCLLLLGLATGQQPRADSSQAWLMDYLRCEVLDQLPGDWQLALFSLAQFPHFDRELCEQLLGAGEGAQMLSQLRECGLFIEPVDQHGRLFRVQPLLAPLLAGQLPDTVVRTLFRKACQWYASREQIRPALACAIKAGQPEMAASLMRCYRDDHLLQGRGPALLLEWCRELPTALRSGSPRLVLLNAWALLISGRLDEGQRYIAALGRFLPQADASRQRELIAQWKALAGKLAFHLGDAERARPLLAEAIAELPERAWCQRLLCYLLQVELALIDGDFDKARHLNRVALRQARGRASQAMESLLVLEHAKLLEVRGELLRAETQLIRLYGELTSAWSAEPSPMRGRTLLQHAGLLLKRGRYEDAETAFVSGLRECLACSDPAAIWGHLGLAELSALQGDVAGAFARIADAERLMQYNQISAHLYQGLSLLARVRLWLGQGSHVQAERALRRLLLEAVPLPPFGAPELNMRLHLALAQAQLAGDQVETALDSLLTLHAKAIGEGRLPLACEAGFSLAEGLYASNRPAQARESLLEARTLARRMGLVSVEQAFASRNPAMMRWACESGGADAAPATLLSRRELDVLRLIVQGCSNRQIAERLFISLYTVKSHAHRINFKLGVERRTQAVARAKDMGLFG